MPVTLSRDDASRMVKTPGHLAELDLGGTTETVLIRDVQWDHLGKEILHLDFARVSAEEIIETEVPLDIRGHAAGIAAGGIVEQVVHSLSIRCKAGAIPDSIKVDISDLQVDQGIHVRDLKLPPDVTVDADPDLLLVHVVTRAAEPEPTAEAGRRVRRPSPRSSSPSARKKRRKVDPAPRHGHGVPSRPWPGRARRGRPIAARSRRRRRSGRDGSSSPPDRGAPALSTLKLVVGLGNPGTKYQGTRHNVGFEVIDRLAQGGSRPSFSRKFDGQVAEAEIDYRRVLLLKPETFMNLSGRSVAQALRFYKLEPTDLLVVCDDLSLPLGKLRLRSGGSDGGQKGLRDITAHLGTDQFPRLRIGIGERGEIDAADFVLEPVPQRRTGGHRRRPDPRHPGRRRVGHPGDRCGHEPFQRSGWRLVASGRLRRKLRSSGRRRTHATTLHWPPAIATSH